MTTTPSGLNPSLEIRNFDGREYIGKEAAFRLEHTRNRDQRVHLIAIDGEKVGYEHPLSNASGWAGSVLGKDNETITRTIKDVSLIEGANGGRGSSRKASSYAEFFNEEHKKIVHAHWTGGLMGRLSRGGGDPERADIILTVDDFKIESLAWHMEAPEEWYSELHGQNPSFKFEAGFYDDADEAIKFLTDKPHDDLFGRRYFPVIVFPERKLVDAQNVASGAKSCSKPIVTNGKAIIGTRCKSHEYAGVIAEAYKKGGLVARALEWDWD